MTNSKASDYRRPVLKLEPDVAERIKHKIQNATENNSPTIKYVAKNSKKNNETNFRRKKNQFNKSKLRNKRKKQDACVERLTKFYCTLEKAPTQEEFVSKLRESPEFSRASENELRRIAKLSVNTIAKRIAQIAQQIEKVRKQEESRTIKRQRVRMKVFSEQRKILDRKIESRTNPVRVPKAQGTEERNKKNVRKKTKIPKIKSSDAMHRAILTGFETNRRRH